MFEKVSTDFDFLTREKEVLAFWKKNDIFKKSIDRREGNDVFTFYDGPPTANGKPHIGHIETRVFKDLFPKNLPLTKREDYVAAAMEYYGKYLERMRNVPER